MSGDMGDVFNAMRAESKARRENNRKASSERLRAAGISFEVRNYGSHLIITHAGHRIDFWPGTGLWMPAEPIGKLRRKYRGVEPLMRHLARLTPKEKK